MSMFDVVARFVGGGSDRDRERERRERQQRERERREREQRDRESSGEPAAAQGVGHAPPEERAAPFRGMYGEDDDREEGGGGLMGMLGSVADRVTSVARDVVRTVAPAARPEPRRAPSPGEDDEEDGGLLSFASGLVDRARDTVAQAAEAAQDAVADAARPLVRAGSEALETVTTSIERQVDAMGRYLEETGEIRAAQNAFHDLEVLAGDVAEETCDLGEGLAEYVEEDLGLGDRPDVHAEPPAPPADSQLAPELREDARRRALEVFAAVDGLGTDPAALRQALRGASADQLAFIRREYWEYTGGADGGQNLDAVLDLELSGSSQREIIGLIRGGPNHDLQQARAILEGASTGLDSEPEVVRDVIMGLDPDQRQRLMDDLGGNAAASRLLSEQLGVAEAHAAMARLRNDDAQAQAIELTDAANGGLVGALGRHFQVEGLGVDSERMNQTLAEIDGSPDARRALEEAMREESARDGVGPAGESESVQQVIDRATEEGAERDLANAIAAGHDGAADAARVAMALEGHWYENPAVIGGTLLVACPIAGAAYLAYHAIDSQVSGRDFTDQADTDSLLETMSRRPGEEDVDFQARREEMRRTFDERYGDGQPTRRGEPDALSRRLDDALTAGSSDDQLIDDLVDDGYVAPERMLRYAIAGHVGSRTDLMRRAFTDPRTGRQLTADEVQVVRERYAAMDGGGHDLIEDLGIGDAARAEYDGPEVGLMSEVSGDEAFEIAELLHGAPQSTEERLAAELRRDRFTRESGWLEGATRSLVDLSGSDAGRLMDLHRDDLEALQVRAAAGEDVDADAALAYHGAADSAYRERVDEATEGVAMTAATAASLAAAAIAEAVTVGGATPLIALLAAGGAGGITELLANGAMRGQRMSNEEIATRLAQTGVSMATAGFGITGVPGAMLGATANEAIQLGSGQRELDDLGDVGALGLRVGGAGLAEAAGNHLTGNMPGGTFAQRLRRGLAAGAISGGMQPLADVDTYDQGLEGALRSVALSAGQGAASSVLDEVIDHAAATRRARREGARFDAAMDQARSRAHLDDGVVDLGAGRPEPAPRVADTSDTLAQLDALDGGGEGQAQPDWDRLVPRTDDRFEIGPDGIPRPARAPAPPPPDPARTLAQLDALDGGGEGQAQPDWDRLVPRGEDRWELDAAGRPIAAEPETGRRALPPRAPETDTTALSAADEFRAGLTEPAEPMNDSEVRQHYQDRIDEIPGVVAEMAEGGASLEEQARRASEIRHQARLDARALMADPLEAANFGIRDLAKYGHADGPPFEQACAEQRVRLEQEALRAGRSPDSVSDDDVHRAVLAGTLRTDAETNARAGVAGRPSESGRPRSEAGPALAALHDMALGDEDVEAFLARLESGSEEDARETAARLTREAARRAQEVEAAGGVPDYDAPGPAPLDPRAAAELAQRHGAPADAPSSSPHLQQALETIVATGTEVVEAGGGTRSEQASAELELPATIVLDPDQLDTPALRARGLAHEGTHAGQGELDPQLQTVEDYVAESALREGRAHAAEAEAWRELRDNGGPGEAWVEDPIYADYFAARDEAFAAAVVQGVDEETARAYAEEVGAQALARRIAGETPGTAGTSGTYEEDWRREWEISQRELAEQGAEVHLDDHGVPEIAAQPGREADAARTALDHILGADHEGHNNGVFTQRPEGSTHAPMTTTYGVDAQGGATMRQGVDASYRMPHAEGDIVRVATGDRTIVVGGDDDPRQIYSTDFTSCGATVIRGRLPDGRVVTLVGHVDESDRFGHHARIASDAQALLDMGARDLQIVAVPGAEVDDPTNRVPDDAEVEVTVDGEPRRLPVGVLRRIDPSVDAHVVVGPGGVAVYEGEDIATAGVTHDLPLRPSPDELFEHLAR